MILLNGVYHQNNITRNILSRLIDGESIDYLWDEYLPYGDVLLEADAGDTLLGSCTLANGQHVGWVEERNPTHKYP